MACSLVCQKWRRKEKWGGNGEPAKSKKTLPVFNLARHEWWRSSPPSIACMYTYIRLERFMLSLPNLEALERMPATHVRVAAEHATFLRWCRGNKERMPRTAVRIMLYGKCSVSPGLLHPSSSSCPSCLPGFFPLSSFCGAARVIVRPRVTR